MLLWLWLLLLLLSIDRLAVDQTETAVWISKILNRAISSWPLSNLSADLFSCRCYLIDLINSKSVFIFSFFCHSTELYLILFQFDVCFARCKLPTWT